MTERETFLSDIIICAIEGGIGYWTQTLAYQVKDEGDETARAIVGEATAKNLGTRAVVRNIEGDGCMYAITPSVIEQGIACLLNGEVSYPAGVQAALAHANDDNDAGMIDADMADDIVQAALLGEIRYG